LECHRLPYFLGHWKEFNYGGGELGPYPTGGEDSARSRRVGSIDGFNIYDIVHEISGDDNSVYLPTVIKMIVVERQPNEFCEIFNEENFAGHDLSDVGPSYIVGVDSQKFLVTHDPINGTCGCSNEAYWSFDKNGPIRLDEHIIWDTLQKLVRLLPPGSEESSNSSPGFDIQNLSFGPYTWWKDNTRRTNGSIFIQFALKNHQLIVASQTTDDKSDHPIPTYGKPPTRINVDGDVQARRLIKKVPPVIPATAASITGTVYFRVLIAKDGSVARWEVIDHDYQLKDLFQPAANAIIQWRYAPTIVDGNPVEVETEIAVTFPVAR
jgi:hypothetical protein